jgi:dTDP-3-amino-3,4,6-trideoxy-alpha-D-glucose transaminase
MHAQTDAATAMGELLLTPLGKRNSMRVRANRFDRFWNVCRAEILEAVSRVGASGRYILGQEVASFERELAEYCGAKYAVGCGNGMDALELSLRALGLQGGQRVLTTPLSAFATTLAIVRAGGIPVFSDVDKDGLLDLDQVEYCLRENPDIRLMVPVHLYGHALDFSKLRDLSERYTLTVVEDAAQAIGAERGGERVGSGGCAACLSFYPTKNLGTLGDGGAIVTDSEELYKALIMFRNYGQEERYVHTRLGLNSRLDELHAAILRRLLPQLSSWARRRRDIAKSYHSGINHHTITLRQGPDFAGSVWHLFPIMIPADRRDSFLDWLKQTGVDADIHYPRLIPDQRAMRSVSAAPLVFGSLTRATEFACQEVSLPINPYLTDEEVGHVITAINDWTE